MDLSAMSRWWSYCGERTSTGCIEWQGAVDSNGYGAFKVDGKKYSAHRAGLLVRGIALTRSDDICHSCDNRRCVNPEHLFVGSRGENMRDASAKNRLASPLRLECKLDASEIASAVIEEKTITAAATRLGCSRWALRRAIRRLRLTF